MLVAGVRRSALGTRHWLPAASSGTGGVSCQQLCKRQLATVLAGRRQGLHIGVQRIFSSLSTVCSCRTQHTASLPTVRASEGATPPQEFDMIWASSVMQ